MIWNKDNIEEMVEYINEQLKTRSMVDIENNDFGENERVIHKRLSRKGYKRVGGFYVVVTDKTIPVKKNKTKKVIPKYNDSYTNKSNESITEVIPHTNNVINANVLDGLNLNSLRELVDLVEPIKEVIRKYNEGITTEKVIEVEPIEVKIDRAKLTGDIKSVGFKLYSDVYDKWREFCNQDCYKNQNIKVQELLAMALVEYMNKYSK